MIIQHYSCFLMHFPPPCKFVVEIDLCLLHQVVYNKSRQWRLGSSSGFRSWICFQLLIYVFLLFYSRLFKNILLGGQCEVLKICNPNEDVHGDVLILEEVLIRSVSKSQQKHI